MPRGSRSRCISQRVSCVASHSVQTLEPRRLLSFSASTLLDSGFVPLQRDGQQHWVKQGQWIVEFEAPASSLRVSKLNTSLASQGIVSQALRFSESLGDKQTFIVKSELSATLDDVQQSLAGIAGIKVVEPDYAIYAASITPNDPRFTDQWGLQQSADHDIDAPEAWELSTGSPSVVIAVPDTGIDYNHLDLATNIWRNNGEIAGNGIDDDANGFIDDTRGWDWVSNDNDPMDDQGHGTLVAGEIGAIGNNSLGVSGVAWQVKLMPLKFVAYTGLGTSSGAMAGMNYAIKQKQAGVNVRAINASWVNNSFSQTFLDTVVALRNNGILFVAASGNGGDDNIGDNNDTMPTYPASYWVDNVVSVAATDSDDQLTGFSNYGLQTVALAAPGVAIIGPTPSNSYGGSTGTSDSAPFVTGTIALAAAAVPNATYLQIKAALIAGVDLLPTLIGKSISGGRLNARKTLDLLIPHAQGDGLSATYFNNANFTGASVTRIDPNVGFDWSSNAPLSGIDRDTYSVRWTGSVMPPTSETYTFYTRADDGVRLWVNGQLIVDRWTDRPLANDINGDGVVNTDDFNILTANFGRAKGSTYAMGDLNADGAVNELDLALLFASWGTTATTMENSGTIALLAGQRYSIQLDYYQNIGRAVSKLSWSSPATPKQIIPQNRLFSTVPTVGSNGGALFPDPPTKDETEGSVPG